jgi:hypothetical protein
MSVIPRLFCFIAFSAVLLVLSDGSSNPLKKSCRKKIQNSDLNNRPKNPKTDFVYHVLKQHDKKQTRGGD